MQRRSLFGLDSKEIGFEVEAHHNTIENYWVRFYTCMPRIYVVGVPHFDHLQLYRYLDEVGLPRPREDQVCGTAADNLIEVAARDCYLSYGSGRPQDKCIANLRKSGHGSTFEHAWISMKIAFVSRGFTHELVRHRVGVAYSQVSSRYVDPHRLGFVVPIKSRDNAWATELFVDTSMNALGNYKNVVLNLEDTLKQTTELSATDRRKTARGNAREHLPIGLHQVLQFSCNARIARHIIRMRASEHADAQIRAFANVLAPRAKTIWPEAFADVETTEAGTTIKDVL